MNGYSVDRHSYSAIRIWSVKDNMPACHAARPRGALTTRTYFGGPEAAVDDLTYRLISGRSREGVSAFALLH